MTVPDARVPELLLGAPPALRERAVARFSSAAPSADTCGRLIDAARSTLRDVLAGDRSRASAPDLLTADTLITLAFEVGVADGGGIEARATVAMLQLAADGGAA